MYRATAVVSCVMCAWYSRSADAPWSRHAGVVHTETLRPGHAVFERDLREDNR